MNLLDVRDLSVEFHVTRGVLRRARTTIRAVQDVSFVIHPRETLGLVGESGCGKSTLSRAILRLVRPSRGSVFLGGHDFLAMRGKELREARRKAQMVFQDPVNSLNPRLTIEDIIGEGLDVHRLTRTSRERRAAIVEVLEDVGLHSSALSRYPHEFSGGQRQRIGIARALAVKPDLLVCDEPVSALDVSIQAQILNLLKGLQQSRGLASLFIAHDLAAVEYVSHRIMVMYLGRIVEEAPTPDLIRTPKHPYTQALIASAPDFGSGPKSPARLGGEMPPVTRPPSGCPFHPRCPLAKDFCRESMPELRSLGSTRRVACHVAEN